MGQAARRRVADVYSIAAVAAEHMELFRTLIERRSPV
jgi:hypothetical protein